jgi:Na+-driven multidrug efflux pump
MTGVSQCYLMIMKVTDHVKECAAISSGAVLLNIVFNAVLIFGLLGLPALNARGAALATTLARLLELLACLLIFTGKEYIRPAWTRIMTCSRALTMDFARQALPLLGGNLLWGVGLTSYTAIIGHVGSDAAAANAVSAVVRDLVCCGCNGIGSAAGIMVGNELGAGKLEKGKRYGIKLRNVSLGHRPSFHCPGPGRDASRSPLCHPHR